MLLVLTLCVSAVGVTRVDATALPPLATQHAAKPATTGLDPRLSAAVEKAMADARADGVELTITSGWRSARHQQELLDAAVKRYGSRAKAEEWVLPPNQSAHVRGRAVDMGPAAGNTWLERHGRKYGLCRRYANESWHFELLTKPGRPCPRMEPHA